MPNSLEFRWVDTGCGALAVQACKVKCLTAHHCLSACGRRLHHVSRSWRYLSHPAFSDTGYCIPAVRPQPTAPACARHIKAPSAAFRCEAFIRTLSDKPVSLALAGSCPVHPSPPPDSDAPAARGPCSSPRPPRARPLGTRAELSCDVQTGALPTDAGTGNTVRPARSRVRGRSH